MGVSDERRARLAFSHEVVDSRPPSRRLVFCHATDLTGNGRPDIIVGGSGMRDKLWINGRGTRFPNYPRILKKKFGINQANVVWYENPGWERHQITDTRRFGVGSALGDIDDDGRADLVVGQTAQQSELYWYEQPEDPRRPWSERLITDSHKTYHDLCVADIDDDGEPEVVGLSQASEAAFYYDIPADPTREPWPASHEHELATGVPLKGAAVVDIDGDGQTELLAGTSIFHQSPADEPVWRREKVVASWDDVRVEVADLDGDGDLEIVYAEGDSPVHGSRPARVAWVDPPYWDVHVLKKDLFCPHSLQIADFSGDGRLDIYVGEQGMGEHDTPRQFVFRNRGDGTFEEQVVAEDVPVHEAQVVDLTGNDRPDIVGKPYHPERRVDVWYNETE